MKGSLPISIKGQIVRHVPSRGACNETSRGGVDARPSGRGKKKKCLAACLSKGGQENLLQAKRGGCPDRGPQLENSSDLPLGKRSSSLYDKERCPANPQTHEEGVDQSWPQSPIAEKKIICQAQGEKKKGFPATKKKNKAFSQERAVVSERGGGGGRRPRVQRNLV